MILGTVAGSIGYCVINHAGNSKAIVTLHSTAMRTNLIFTVLHENAEVACSREDTRQVPHAWMPYCFMS